jgi:hypothetical protein
VFAKLTGMYVTKENVMKINLLTKRVIGFVFALSLLLGVGMTASSTAQAQNRSWEREQARRQREWEREQQRRHDRDWRDNDRRYDNDRYGYGGSFQLRQTALNAGYNEGIKEGRKDRRNGERY